MTARDESEDVVKATSKGKAIVGHTEMPLARHLTRDRQPSDTVRAREEHNALMVS